MGSLEDDLGEGLLGACNGFELESTGASTLRVFSRTRHGKRQYKVRCATSIRVCYLFEKQTSTRHVLGQTVWLLCRWGGNICSTRRHCLFNNVDNRGSAQSLKNQGILGRRSTGLGTWKFALRVRFHASLVKTW